MAAVDLGDEHGPFRRPRIEHRRGNRLVIRRHLNGGPVYSIADDGSVTVTAAFRAFYAEAQGTDPGIGLVQEAERNAAQLQRQLKLLLVNAAMGAEYADWKITNALLGVTAEERPFQPTETIPKPPKPNGPRIGADQDGSGPKDYDSVDPGLLDELGLTALRAGALFGGAGWAQNFDVVGTSSNRTTKLSLPH